MNTTDTDKIECYNFRGECIYRKMKNGVELWYDYDSNGRKISARCSVGFKECWDYDENGLLTRYISSMGDNIRYEYLLNGTLAYEVDLYGVKTWYGKDGLILTDPVAIMFLAEQLYSDKPHLLMEDSSSDKELSRPA